MYFKRKVYGQLLEWKICSFVTIKFFYYILLFIYVRHIIQLKIEFLSSGEFLPISGGF